jgi:hypothetical protein
MGRASVTPASRSLGIALARSRRQEGEAGVRGAFARASSDRWLEREKLRMNARVFGIFHCGKSARCASLTSARRSTISARRSCRRRRASRCHRYSPAPPRSPGRRWTLRRLRALDAGKSEAARAASCRDRVTAHHERQLRAPEHHAGPSRLRPGRLAVAVSCRKRKRVSELRAVERLSLSNARSPDTASEPIESRGHAASRAISP